MALKARLDALRRAGGAAAKPQSPDAGLQQRLQRMQVRSAAPESKRCEGVELARRLGGAYHDAGVVILEQRIPMPDVVADSVSAAWPLGESVTGRRLYFFDTETNGLAGGTGTIAFLLGGAWFETGELVVRQYLLTGYAGEPAMLERFATDLQGDRVLVTYNGKRFDNPLLGTRCRLHGRTDALAGRPHADLLYPVRRLFGSRWPDCRLVTAEQMLLGRNRDGDLPGSEAPMAWVAWLRRGDPGPIAGVVEHNRRDLVSLARLWLALQQLYDQPQVFDPDLVACARIYQEFAGDEPAYEFLCASRPRLDADGLRMLAGMHRRFGDWASAVEIWQLLAPGGCQVSIAALAKYHEHRAADPQTALQFAVRLSDPLDREKRLRRLRDKLDSHPDAWPLPAA